jgi:predicted dehydrogenase
MLRVCLIGYGYWGKNLLRNLLSINDCKVECVCESNAIAAQKIKSAYPDLSIESDYNQVLSNSKIDAVVIATPTHTHFELAKKALESGKHVLVEKPFTTSVQEAETLINIAQQKNLVLMVDHTFLYSGAVKKIKSLIDSDTIGKLQYFDSTRINLGLIQSDINVLWDLAPHDLSILSYICNEEAIGVTASGISHTNNNIENIAYMTINYPSGFIAHLNCSWSSPVKVRTTLIGGDKKMIVYDDINPTEKVKVYDSGFDFKNDEDKSKIYVDYRIGDIYIPKLKTDEPLRNMLEDFFQSIVNNKLPVSNYALALKTVKILEASQKSIKQNSNQISI